MIVPEPMRSVPRIFADGWLSGILACRWTVAGRTRWISSTVAFTPADARHSPRETQACIADGARACHAAVHLDPPRGSPYDSRRHARRAARAPPRSARGARESDGRAGRISPRGAASRAPDDAPRLRAASDP